MIITCSNCNTNYQVSEKAIGEHGRFVRCTKCGYEWVATLPEPTPMTEPQEQNKNGVKPSVQDEPEKTVTPIAANQPDTIEEQLNRMQAEPEKPKNIEQAEDDDISMLRPLRRATIAGHVPSPAQESIPLYQRNWFFYGSVVLSVSALLLLICLFLVVYRENITHHIPSAQRIYKKFGLYDHSNLVFGEITCKVSEQESQDAGNTQTLEVTVPVMNIGKTRAHLKALRISIFDQNMKKLDQVIMKKDMLIKPNDERFVIQGKLWSIPQEAHFIAYEMDNYIDLYLHNPKKLRYLYNLKQAKGKK